MAQINGRQESSQMRGATPLEKILGKRVFSSKYFTDNAEEYSKWLTHQNLVDLHRHSMEVMGEMVRGDRERVVLRLKEAFANYHKQVKAIETQSKGNHLPKHDPKAPKNIDEILKRGGK